MLVTFNGVNFSYTGEPVLKDIGFAVNEGERIGLIGENGAGKTTLLKLVTGELLPESGEVLKKNGIGRSWTPCQNFPASRRNSPRRNTAARSTGRCLLRMNRLKGISPRTTATMPKCA